jgi:toxin ParE1/3/4
MKRRRLIFSDAAIADILEQADWYLFQSGRKLARRWERAVKSTISEIVRRPATGSLCTFRIEALRDVRRITITGFPKHLLFYRFRDEEVFILRVVHAHAIWSVSFPDSPHYPRFLPKPIPIARSLKQC